MFHMPIEPELAPFPHNRIVRERQKASPNKEAKEFAYIEDVFLVAPYWYRMIGVSFG